MSENRFSTNKLTKVGSGFGLNVKVSGHTVLRLGLVNRVFYGVDLIYLT